MRLFLAAIIVVVAFVSAALLISRLFPYGAGWAGVCVAVTVLYASAFAAWALQGKQTGKSAATVPTRRHLLRDNVLYFSLGMVVVTVMVAVIVHDDETGVVRSFRNDWFVAFGSAVLAVGYAAKGFWRFRANWRLWAVIIALFTVFTTTTLPVLSEMEKVPLLLGGPLANIEFLIAFGVLHWFFGERPPAPDSALPR